MSQARALAAALCALAGAVACSAPPAAVVQEHPTITLEPAVVDFGEVLPNSTATAKFKITAGGTGNVTFKSLTIGNDARHAFTATGLPEKLVPGTSAEITVTYAAGNDALTDAASITIENGSENAPHAAESIVARTKAAACDDGIKDGIETDADCGGGTCAGCAGGKQCSKLLDCVEGLACIAGHCGTCGTSADCATGQVCEAGSCKGCASDAQCAAGQTCEKGLCTSCPGSSTPIDTRTDPKHCGSCDKACPSPVHADATCVAAKCGRARCAPGYFDIDGDKTLGCESTCTGASCTDGAHSWTFDAAPLPETGQILGGAVTAAGFSDQMQSNAAYTNLGSVGEVTPPQVNGAVSQSNAGYIHQGGLVSLEHAATNR